MTGTRRLGAEWESHELTIMSWPTARIWGEDLPYVREDIANLAATIAEFEAVILMASPGDEKDAEYQAGKNVEVITMPVDDLWARDTVPVFVEGADGVTGVDSTSTAGATSRSTRTTRSSGRRCSKSWAFRG